MITIHSDVSVDHKILFNGGLFFIVFCVTADIFDAVIVMIMVVVMVVVVVVVVVVVAEAILVIVWITIFGVIMFTLSVLTRMSRIITFVVAVVASIILRLMIIRNMRHFGRFSGIRIFFKIKNLQDRTDATFGGVKSEFVKELPYYRSNSMLGCTIIQAQSNNHN